MVSKSIIKVSSAFGHEINNLYLTHSPKSKSIAVLFPGGNGTCDNPVLHYARKAVLLSGCDVLSLEYGYVRTDKTYKTEFREQTVKEVNETIEKCLGNSYENIYFISKSLGTSIAGTISKSMGYNKVRNLFLTPTVYAIPHIINSKCTVIVGTKDRIFPREYIDIISAYPSVNLIIINNAVHSLEIEDDCMESLEILGTVTKLCADFVGNK